MTHYIEGVEPPDNATLREIRDVLNESRKHTWAMIALTVIIAVLTLVMIIKV